MSEFLDLPEELLLAIVNRVQYDTSTSRQDYRDLRSIALSCLKLRPIAQEVLHTEVTIQRARSLRGLNNLAYLARTLIQRPDLALKVRTLDLGIIGNPVMHSSDCSHLIHPEEQDCTCRLKGVISLCIVYLRTVITIDGLSLHNQSWVKNIREGLQLAIVGLILCITPRLESLALGYRKQRLAYPTGFHTKPIGMEHIGFNDLFGSATEIPGFSIERIKGFTKLTRLSTNTFPTANILRLPQLEALELGLLDNQYNEAPTYIRRSINSADITLSTTLIHLVVQLDKLALYSDRVIEMAGMYKHLRNTIKNLAALKYLSLNFGCSWGNRFNTELGDLSEASYEYVTSKLESLSLTHLTLDIEDTKRTWFDESYDAVLVEEIYPMTSFVRLPNLRYITAPQEAFFTPHDYDKCDLPTSIEVIGIISPTHATTDYISHLLGHQERWPNLRLTRLETGMSGSEYCRGIADAALAYVHNSDFDSDSGTFYARCLELSQKLFGLSIEGVWNSDVWVELGRDRFAWMKWWPE